jgi:VWFA-related protein
MQSKRFWLVAVLLILVIMPFQLIAQVPQDKAKPQTNQETPQPNKQEEDGVLKVSTDLVTVPLSVTDKKNRYITDLKQEDLLVMEDGKLQEVFSFTKETDLPLTFALLIDISGSQELTLPAQREAALKFLEKVIRNDKDLASVITFRKDVEMLQNLTSNVDQIRRTLNAIRFTGSTSSLGSPPIGGSDFAGTSLYDAVYVTSDELLAKEAGRRVVILLTDGRDTTSSYGIKQAIERSLRSEVLIYAIGIEGRGQYGGNVFNQDVDKKTLQTLCEETGGRFFLPKNENEYFQAFRQIEDDLRQQYILSYSPTNDTPDGSFRNITIKINRKDSKDLKVLCRRGYYAKKGA